MVFSVLAQADLLLGDLFNKLDVRTWFEPKRKNGKTEQKLVNITCPRDLKTPFLRWLNLSVRTKAYREHPITKMMKQHYPSVVYYVEYIKRMAHANGIKRPHKVMSYMLCRAEVNLVKIFLSAIRKQLGWIPACIFHDAIWTTASYAERIRQICIDACPFPIHLKISG